MLFTIQEFSKKTGLPPSKLRFYDKKGVLMPSTRLENGYRAYSADQIHLAKMIDSLRQADISIEDIKHYTEADEQDRKTMLERWKKDLDKKMEVLLAARKYVGGIQAENAQTLLLSKWEKEKSFIWQTVEADRSPHPFKEHFKYAKSLLEKQGVPCSEQAYLKNERINGNKIIAELGFELEGSFHLSENDSLRYERFPPTLFAVLQDCRADNAFLCFSYIQLVIRYGFQPAGDKIQRYSNIDADTFDYLIPLVK